MYSVFVLNCNKGNDNKFAISFVYRFQSMFEHKDIVCMTILALFLFGLYDNQAIAIDSWHILILMAEMVFH